MSRFLKGSPTVEDAKDEIPSFLIEETEAELHFDTINGRMNSKVLLTSTDLCSAVDFIGNYFDDVYHVLTMKEAKSPRL